jgi:hypothetical protein
MNEDLAQTRALGVLGWIASQQDIFPVFLGATGSTEADLRQRIAEPEFLAAVVDFLMLDDAWVIDCAEANGWQPNDIALIRAGLPGGDLPNWT